MTDARSEIASGEFARSQASMGLQLRLTKSLHIEHLCLTCDKYTCNENEKSDCKGFTNNEGDLKPIAWCGGFAPHWIEVDEGKAIGIWTMRKDQKIVQ